MCQDVIRSQGRLHFGAVSPLTKDSLPKLGMRDGWQAAFHSLTQKGVPTFVFSSGYGDVVTQALVCLCSCLCLDGYKYVHCCPCAITTGALGSPSLLPL